MPLIIGNGLRAQTIKTKSCVAELCPFKCLCPDDQYLFCSSLNDLLSLVVDLPYADLSKLILHTLNRTSTFGIVGFLLLASCFLLVFWSF